MKLLSAIAALLLSGAALAQNGAFSFVHGLPGLAAPVDINLNGNTVFSGVSFGSLNTTSVAPGAYSVEVVGGGAVLLSGTATIAADASVSAAAHLQLGGGATLSVLDNDLSAVDIAGDCRITLHHFADTAVALWGAESTNASTISFSAAGASIPLQSAAGDYNVRFAPFDPASGNVPLPIPASALSTGNVTVGADRGIDVYIVGTPGTASYAAIVQNLTLEPATPIVINPCDLTLSGSLVGGSGSAGGDVTYSLTGATPNSFVAVFLGFDTTPLTLFNIPLGIGGSGGLGTVDFGMADAMGNYSFTQTYQPITVVTPPLPGGVTPPPPQPFALDFYIQAVSVESGAQSFLPTCVSDIELLQINFP